MASVHAMELEERGQGRTTDASSQEMRPFLTIGGVALGALIFQAFFEGFTARNTGMAADVLEGFPLNLGGGGDTNTPFPPHPTVGPTIPPVDECGKLDMYNYWGEDFENSTTTYYTDFATLYMQGGDWPEAYLEMDMHQLQEGAIKFGASTILENGDMAHEQTYPQLPMDHYLWLFKLSSEGDTVDVVKQDMRHRHGSDRDYDAIFDETFLPDTYMRLRVQGARTTKSCEVTSLVVSASYLFDALSHTWGSIDADSVKAFPTNIDLRFISYSHTVRMCMFELPKKHDMMPGRVADDRAGYHINKFQYLGDMRKANWPTKREDMMINPIIRLINRMRLPSRYPHGGKKNTIHFWVDPSVPPDFMQATREGIEMWQTAFDGLTGFPEDDPPRIVAHLPEDADWPADYDVGDIRFNVVSWALGHEEAKSYDGWVQDVRTGEILKADILMTMGHLKNVVSQQVIFGAMDHSNTLKNDARFVQAANAWAAGESSMKVKLDAQSQDHGPSVRALINSPTAASAHQQVKDAIRQTTSHEIGHALGLLNNFRGSSDHSFEQCQDRSFVAQHGTSSSIMDDMAVNYISKKARSELKSKWGENGPDPDEAYLYSPVIGAYDKFAIKYGYQPLAIEMKPCPGGWCPMQDQLLNIAKEYDTGDFSFASEVLADGMDPYNTRQDFCGPVKFLKDQFEVVEEGFESLFNNSMRDNQPWTDLYYPISVLMKTYGMAGIKLARFIGGVKPERKHGRKMLTQPGNIPVPLEDQSEALLALLDALRRQPPAWMQKDAVSHAAFYSVDPYFAEFALNDMKVAILDAMLDEQRLEMMQLTEPLLGASGRVQSWLLSGLSSHLLGMPHSNPTISPVIPQLRNTGLWPVQRAYIQKLGSLRASGYLSSTLKGAVEGEVIRLHDVLTAAMKHDGMSLMMQSYIGGLLDDLAGSATDF